MHIKELDSMGLIKLCAADMSNATAWQELVARFSDNIQYVKAQRAPESKRVGAVPKGVDKVA